MVRKGVKGRVGRDDSGRGDESLGQEDHDSAYLATQWAPEYRASIRKGWGAVSRSKI